MTTSLSASDIMILGRGFMEAKVLLVAAKLGLFDELQAGPLTGSEIGQRLRLHARAIPDFPDALVALGVLEREVTAPARGTRTRRQAPTAWYAAGPHMSGGSSSYTTRERCLCGTTWKRRCAPERLRTRPNTTVALSSTSSTGTQHPSSDSSPR